MRRRSSSQLEAAELLGVGERTFRRWCQRYEEDGEAGLLDRRLGKASGKRVPADREARSSACIGRATAASRRSISTSIWCATTGSPGATPGRRRSCSRESAGEGAAARGAPAQAAASAVAGHDAAPGRLAARVAADGQPALDLVVTMDDATSEIYSAFLVEEEGTDSTFRALLEVFGRHGLPLSLYTDRGSHYFHTAEAGGKVDRGQPTQVGRALAHLGVEHIAAYSPQARGRSERLFQTLQDRLPKELALAGITDDGGGQRLAARHLYTGAQRAVRGQGRAGGQRLRRGAGAAIWRGPVRSGRTRGRQRQLRVVQSQAADPGEPAACALRQGDGESASIPRRSHAIFHGPRCLGRYDHKACAVERQCRLNPLGGEPVDGLDKSPTCPSRTEQKQKKRTFDVLPKPDNLISYRQGPSHRVYTNCSITSGFLSTVIRLRRVGTAISRSCRSSTAKSRCVPSRKTKAGRWRSSKV